MTSRFPRRLLLVPACGATAIVLLIGHTATAQSATGTITGRVLWSNCIRAIPLPDAQSQSQPQLPSTANGLPAGAVLVAVQSTSISARTDEAGNFSLPGAPAGQYLTVAAGPVANATAAVAERPNVMVNGGQTVDLGTLSLGGNPVPISIACRGLPGPQTSTAPGPDNATPTEPTSP